VTDDRGKPPIDPRLLLGVAVLATIGIVLLYALTIFDACGSGKVPPPAHIDAGAQ
jgi:hypothetical protein